MINAYKKIIKNIVLYIYKYKSNKFMVQHYLLFN